MAHDEHETALKKGRSRDKSGDPIVAGTLYPLGLLPKTVYVEGFRRSESAGDIDIAFMVYRNGASLCEDLVKATVIGVNLALERNEMRVNADFDEQNENGHKEDFREPNHMVPDDPDLLCGLLTVEPPFPGEFTLDFDPTKTGVWICSTLSEPTCYLGCVGAWWQVFPGESFLGDPNHPDNPICVLIEGLDGSLATSDASITPAFRVDPPAEGGGSPADLTVVESQFMLTFDDGPYRFAWNANNNHPSMDCPQGATSTILAKLATTWVDGAPVKAAFFVVGHDGSNRDFLYDPVTMTEGVDGEGQDNGDLVQAINSSGHKVGNHTNTHYSVKPWTPIPTVEAEIQACEDKIAAASVPITKIFRPPYMAIWARDRAVQAATNKGYQLIWGSTHEDWETGATAEAVSNDIIAHMTDVWNTRDQPNRKPLPNIVVLHDPGPPTARYLETIVGGVRDKGFVLVQFDSSQASSNWDYYTNPDAQP